MADTLSLLLVVFTAMTFVVVLITLMVMIIALVNKKK